MPATSRPGRPRGKCDPCPASSSGIPEVRYTRWGLGALVLGALLALPLWLSESKINLAAVIVIFGIVGISLVVLTGWAGQVSLGQMAFVGIGAAVGGGLTANQGLDIGIALLVGGIVGALIAVVVGYPAIRRGGLTLPVITLAFALLTSSYLLNQEFFDSWLPSGRIERSDFLGLIDISTETRYYYFCLAGLALMYVAARGIRNSRTGRALIAIRENEQAARARTASARLARRSPRSRRSGFMAAFAGVLYVHHQSGLGTAAFLPNESLTAFSMVVIGGLGSLSGALIGAFYVRGAQYFLPGNWAQLASGAGLLLVLMILPGGIGAAMADVRDGYLRWVARRRNILVPSLLADRKADEPVVIRPKRRSRGRGRRRRADPERLHERRLTAGTCRRRRTSSRSRPSAALRR